MEINGTIHLKLQQEELHSIWTPQPLSHQDNVKLWGWWVKYFQDLEDYAAAYKIARDDWAANPSLKWPKTSIAWLLIRMMKYNARAHTQQQFLSQLEEFHNLGILADEKKLWSAVAWPVRDIINDSFQMQWFTPEFGD